MGATCTVQIKGDSIKIMNDGKGNLKGKKGDVLDQGLLIQHAKTRKWVIAHNVNDINAKDISHLLINTNNCLLSWFV